MASQQSGPPYASTMAQLGGRPTTRIDDPICGVFLGLFLLSAVVNMAIFIINMRRDHKFVFSAMLFGFSLLRCAAMVMRIVWASRPNSIKIAIAASILTLAGVIILFIINLLFTQRILRACRPHFGWRRSVRVFFRSAVALVPACLIMVVVATVHSFFTLSANAHRMERDIQLVCGVIFAVLAFLPLPLLLLIFGLPPRPRLRARHADSAMERFGRGRLATKVWMLVFTSILLSLGAGFRIGVNFSPRPLSHPAWYHSRACYYCFNFAIEVIVVYIYTLSRFDQRFHIPNGAKGPGHYAAHYGTHGVAPAPVSYGLVRHSTFSDRVNTEADVFGTGSDTEGGDLVNPEKRTEERAREWDSRVQQQLQRENEGQSV